MVGELDILNEWIPEQMQPGTIFVLEMLVRSARKKILIGPCSLALRAECWA